MAAEKRIALVMGNSAYQNVGRLANPANDARLIAKVLRAQGFEVIERLDLTQKKMKRAIRDFTNRLRKAGRDAIGFVFYAGHGLQIRGLNYLVPVDAEIATEGVTSFVIQYKALLRRTRLSRRQNFCVEIHGFLSSRSIGKSWLRAGTVMMFRAFL